MRYPEVTVLMTVYNGGEYLKISIESLLKQTLKDFEILIVNDCSTDQSMDIISSYRDERITVVTNLQNLGQTKSLNEGLRRAKGRYIARLDADDYAFPNWLEYQLEYMKEHPEFAVGSTKAVVIDGENRPVKVLNTPVSTEDIIMKSLVSSPINHVGALMDKPIVLSMGGYDENYKIAADFHLWSKIIKAGYRLSSTEKVLVAIRVHNRSVSILEKGRCDFKEVTRIIKENVETLTDCSLDENDCLLLWHLFYNVDKLDDGQFKIADRLFKKCCQGFKNSLGIAPSAADRFFKDRRLVYYAKRILAQAEKVNIKELRYLCSGYLKENGYWNGISGIWLLSFFGRRVLKLFLVSYAQLISVVSRARWEGIPG